MLSSNIAANSSQWWKEAVFYQVYPRSFLDTSGDGNGDLKGIIKKLPYLQKLGIDAIWLSPIYTSPMVDNGYDISDYYSINPMFGDMEDFLNLLKSMHERGMKLMMDLVINHTSIEHPWFLESRSSRDNPKRDWYIWRDPKDDAEPNNWASHFMDSAWQWEDISAQYYFHMFSRHQADLNWDNPEVKKEMFEMVRYWLDKGVDAFRMDMANYLIKEKGLPDAFRQPGDNRPFIHGEGLYANRPGMHELVNELKETVLEPYGAALFGELYFLDPQTALKYTAYDRHEFDMIYQYEIVGASGNWQRVKESTRVWYEAFKDRAWNSITFSNHDSPRPVSVFGDSGRRDESAKCIATYLLTVPGTPFFLQGEEIAMTNVRYNSLSDYSDVEMKGKYDERIRQGEDPDWVFADLAKWSRDNARTPMQWSGKRKNAGFSSGQPWLGVNQNYRDINVADQTKDKNSVLNYYKKLIKLKHRYKALSYGEYITLTPDDWETYAYKRVLDKEILIIVLNTSPCYWQMQILDELQSSKKLLLSNYAEFNDTENELSLRPWEARIYKLD